MTDPIADFLTRVRNAVKANHKVVEAPASKMKKEITRIKTFDSDGRRIFLSGEFGSTGVSVDAQYLCHHRIGPNPLEILDGSNDKKVFRLDNQDTKNYALTKDDFVQHIIAGDPGFDSFSFEGFRPTLDMIKMIVQDAEKS